jgi:hypothetical protein
LGYKGPDLLRVVKEGQLDISEIVSTGLTAAARSSASVPCRCSSTVGRGGEVPTESPAPTTRRSADEWNQKLLVVSSWPFAFSGPPNRQGT